METAKVQRLNFREFGEAVQIETVVAGARKFLPSGTSREEAPPPPPPPPAPTFNEEQLKTAERDAYKKGFLEGTTEGHKQAEGEQAIVDKNLAALLENFVQAISPLFDDYREMTSRIQQEMPKVALAIAKKVAGNALEQNSPQVVTDIAARCCETMINEAKLTITAHDSMGNTLEQKLRQMAGNLPAALHIIIVRDPEMPLSDCRIDWENGSMERSVEQLWQKVEKVIHNMTATVKRDAQEHMDKLWSKLPPAPPAPEIDVPTAAPQQNIKPDQTPSSEKE